MSLSRASPPHVRSCHEVWQLLGLIWLHFGHDLPPISPISTHFKVVSHLWWLKPEMNRQTIGVGKIKLGESFQIH